MVYVSVTFTVMLPAIFRLNDFCITEPRNAFWVFQVHFRFSGVSIMNKAKITRSMTDVSALAVNGFLYSLKLVKIVLLSCYCKGD